ncbi:hypothetical protein [Lysobacter sp. ESA13C]|uniref:hypothetical protein n=1 Tax=Lysobacter sp. ESA13C TaxID=2862676 RepID=UPI001CBEA612|nr:hypothetical protein [Lysobacter sp. ESA13C]
MNIIDNTQSQVSTFHKMQLAAVLLALSPFAMAADFDGTEIVTKVVAYTAVGVLILGAFALGRWTLRAMGLIGGK